MVIKPKILTVTTISRTNKAFLVDIIKNLTDFDHYAAASDIEESDIISNFNTVVNLPLQRSLKSFSRFGKFRNKLREFITENKIDIVHVHTPVAALITRLSLVRRTGSRYANVKVVYTAHGFHFFPGNAWYKNFAYILAEKLCGRFTDVLIVMNSTDFSAANKYRIVSVDRLKQVMGIGIDLAKYNGLVIQDTKENERYFICLAEFIPRKRQSDVIAAVSLSSKDYSVYFAGDGPDVEKMQLLVKHLGLTDRIKFLGQRSDVPQLIRGSLGLILVSAQEGLPRSIMEAMALRKIVIGSKIRGTLDLLSGNCGVLVDVGDRAAIAAAMDDIYSHPGRYDNFVENAYRKIQLYDINRVVKAYREIYNNLAKVKYDI